MQVLVVCIGNMCRSPLAEQLLRQRCDVVRPGVVHVTSAGTRARDGGSMEQRAAVQLERLGGDPAAHVARRLMSADVVAADLVLTATKDLRTEVVQLAPSALGRTFSIGELADIIDAGKVGGARVRGGLPPRDLVARAAARRPDGHRGVDVLDPIGRSDDTHRAVADQLDALVDRIVPFLLRTGS